VSVYQANAQKLIEKHLDFSKKTKVVLDLQIADSIKINTWNKNEVYAKAKVNINENKDNDVYNVSFDDSGNEVKITAEFKSEYLNKKNNCMNTEIYWEILIPDNSVFSVKTISGNIIIEGKTSEITAHTISGFVDLTVPSGKKADLTFKTISGTIYSNHEFIDSNSKHEHMPKLNEQINGGGCSINLESISGDIYFRKL